jgi:hypothetical protein
MIREVTNSTVQNSSSEVDRNVSGQEIPRHLGKSTVHCYVHRTLFLFVYFDPLDLTPLCLCLGNAKEYFRLPAVLVSC